jgi:hypothetical protein
MYCTLPIVPREMQAVLTVVRGVAHLGKWNDKVAANQWWRSLHFVPKVKMFQRAKLHETQNIPCCSSRIERRTSSLTFFSLLLLALSFTFYFTNI